MHLTVAEVIKQVRDKHPAFTEYRITSAVLARHLSTYERDLVTKAAAVNKFWLVKKKTLYLPVPVFEDGYALPQAEHVLEGTVTLTEPTGAVRKLNVTTYDDRFTPRRWPSAYMLRNILYLMGGEASWADAAQIELRIVPVVVEVTMPNGIFTVPSRAAGCLVAEGALFCARRLPVEVGPKGIIELQTAAASAEKTFLSGIASMSATS